MTLNKQRRASIAVSSSLIGAAPLNADATNHHMTEVEESPETLQNIMRVTRDQESVFKVVYTSHKIIIFYLVNVKLK